MIGHYFRIHPVQSLFGSQVALEPSSTISSLSTKEFEGHLFIKLLPPLWHIDLPTYPTQKRKHTIRRYPKWDRTSLVTGWCCGPRWEHWEHRLMILFQKLDFCLQLLNHLLFEFSETKQEAELWLDLSSMDFPCKQAILTERDHPQLPTRRWQEAPTKKRTANNRQQAIQMENTRNSNDDRESVGDFTYLVWPKRFVLLLSPLFRNFLYPLMVLYQQFFTLQPRRLGTAKTSCHKCIFVWNLLLGMYEYH